MNVALKPLASQVILEMLGVFCNQFILCIVVQIRYTLLLLFDGGFGVFSILDLF
jgi:hypothetical protein